MSQIDVDENLLSETTAGAGDLKLVPVAESIRYRRRAQAAEKANEILTERLAEADARAAQIQEELDGIAAEQKLTRKLAGAGVVDLETAVLLAKSKVKSCDDAELDSVVERLKIEKQYLFAGKSVGAVSQKTAGAKGRADNGSSVLERAAKKAAGSGNRADLQEYLRLRRNFV